MGKTLVIKGADFSAVAVDTIPTNYITITVSASPSSGGTTVGSGNYIEGQQVQISATANYGYVFSQWNDGNTNATRTITVSSSAETYTATFVVDTNVWLLGIAPDTEGELGQARGDNYVYSMTAEASANLAGRTISKVIMMVNDYYHSVIGTSGGTIDDFKIGYCDANNENYNNITWLTEAIDGITNKTPMSFTPITIPNGKIVVLDFGSMGYSSGKYNVAKITSIHNIDKAIKRDGTGATSLSGGFWVDFQ